MSRTSIITILLSTLTIAFSACSSDEPSAMTPVDSDMYGWWTGEPSGERVLGELVITRAGDGDGYDFDFTAQMTPGRAMTVWIIAEDHPLTDPAYLGGGLTGDEGDVALRLEGFSTFTPVQIAVHDHYLPIDEILAAQISTETAGCEDSRWPEQSLNPCKYSDHLFVNLPE